jgi:hypothetical protein
MLCCGIALYTFVCFSLFYLVQNDYTFFSDLRQVGGFLWVLQFPPPIKLTATIYNIVESGIKHHNPYQKLIAMDYYNSGSNSLNQLFN